MSDLTSTEMDPKEIALRILGGAWTIYYYTSFENAVPLLGLLKLIGFTVPDDPEELLDMKGLLEGESDEPNHD